MGNIHLINDNKFKGVNISFNYTLDIEKRDISKFSILASILSKCSKKYNNQTEIEKHLFKLYGSGFDTSVQKLGDLYNIEFNMEFLNKKYLENNLDMLKPCLEFLNEIIYNPIFKENNLDNKLFEREKESILYKVKSRKDDKMQYAISQTENLMSSDTLFGGYLYGDEEILENLIIDDILQAYDTLINESVINIVISGNLEGYDNIKNEIKNVFKNNLNNKDYINLEIDKGFTNNKYIEEFEAQNINQAILTYGLRVKDVTKNDIYKLMLYNNILGGTASSKLFQNFTEKESLAYTVRSKYYRFKNVIIIYAGIDKENFEKSKLVINNELNNMKNNITLEEFNSSKESLLSDINQWNDSKISISKINFFNMLYFKNTDETIEVMYNKIKEIKLEDIKELAKKVYVDKVYLLGGDSNE